MIKVLASFIHLALFTIVALGVAATTVHADTTEPEIGQYADVGDIRMYYESRGEGGAVALELLINYSDPVRTATLIGTPLTVSEADKKWFDTERVATKEKRFEDAVSVAGKMYKTYQRLAPDPSRWPIVMDKMYGGGSAQPTYSANMLGSITRPVLVIKTEHDQFYGPEIFDQTAKSIADAEIFSIPEGKHNVPMTHPEQVTGAIRDFVARRGAGPVSAIPENRAR
jgi:pimeloyl-ACP methyl ester carboxylesterase